MHAVKAIMAKHPDVWGIASRPNSTTSSRRNGRSWRVGRDNIVSPTIIFTSESTDMVREQHEFVTKLRDRNSSIAADFATFRIVSNTLDVTQDTGQVKNKPSSNISADSAMLSALASLKFQLLSRVTVGNCCSNFHVLVADLLAAGCGAARTNNFYCMQENENPHLRICCGWQKWCFAAKQRAIDELVQGESTHH